ncbi:MAG: tail fiber domain-containing protein [Patescibacteria group bacterium]|nr:tail fiber domain-containing protein [Patescibacteria group bacterium]
MARDVGVRDLMRGILHEEDFGWSAAPRFGGGGNETVTQNTNSAPWSGQTPYLTGDPSGGIQGIFPAAANLYNNPSDYPQYYPSSTYSPLTNSQQQFIAGAGTYGANLGNSGVNSANNALTTQLSPGFTSGTQAPMDAANSYLSGIIGGNTLNPFTAPGFQNVINGTLANVLPATSASFINGGRADSGLATNAETAAATNAIGSLANQNYLQEQGLQQGAAAQAANNLLTQQGNQTKDIAFAPGVDQSQLSDLNAGLQAAGMEQTNNQNLLNYDVSKWNYNQALPFNMLGQYQNYVGGTGYGGTTTGQSTQPTYSNTLASILGTGAAGVGLASGLSSLLGYSSLGGSGGSLAALGTLLGLSDRRLKADIHRIGKSDSGFPLYVFRYKSDDPGTMHIGLMAQDVKKSRPEAVLPTPFGMMVDYGKALAA